jgi:multisubunit Na+/H+ antiporter MnhE subunit
MLVYFAVVFFCEVAYNFHVLIIVIETVLMQAPDIGAVDIEFNSIKFNKHALGVLPGALV